MHAPDMSYTDTEDANRDSSQHTLASVKRELKSANGTPPFPDSDERLRLGPLAQSLRLSLPPPDLRALLTWP